MGLVEAIDLVLIVFVRQAFIFNVQTQCFEEPHSLILRECVITQELANRNGSKERVGSRVDVEEDLLYSWLDCKIVASNRTQGLQRALSGQVYITIFDKELVAGLLEDA